MVNGNYNPAQEARVNFPSGFGAVGEEFTLSVTIDKSVFHIYVNGVLLTTYPNYSQAVADLSQVTLDPASTSQPTVCATTVEVGTGA